MRHYRGTKETRYVGAKAVRFCEFDRFGCRVVIVPRQNSSCQKHACMELRCQLRSAVFSRGSEHSKTEIGESRRVPDYSTFARDRPIPSGLSLQPLPSFTFELRSPQISPIPLPAHHYITTVIPLYTPQNTQGLDGASHIV